MNSPSDVLVFKISLPLAIILGSGIGVQIRGLQIRRVQIKGVLSYRFVQIIEVFRSFDSTNNWEIIAPTSSPNMASKGKGGHSDESVWGRSNVT